MIRPGSYVRFIQAPDIEAYVLTVTLDDEANYTYCVVYWHNGNREVIGGLGETELERI